MFTVLDSYVSQSPSTFMVVTLEDSDIVYIHHDEMEKLCRKHRCIEHLFRNLVSFAALNMMKRINEMLEDDASKRYLNFRNDNYDLMQRISLGDLASYLGITQVSLSRIRAKK